MPSHRINLKGPWDFEWLTPVIDTPNPDFPKSGTVSMPRDWQSIFGPNAGTVEFRRKFHRPTNLEPHERVMLVLTEVRGGGEVQLNEKFVGEFRSSSELVEFEIGPLLQPFNVLAIKITFDPQEQHGLPGGLFAPVALEIRAE